MKFLALLLALALPPTVYFPTLGAQLDRREREAEDKDADVTLRLEQARAAQRKLPQFREEKERLATELEKLRRILPPELDVDGIQSTLDSIASANGVRVTRFQPREPEVEDRQQSIRIEIEVTGTAPNTATFLRRVHNASRIFDATSTTMQRDPAGWRTAFILTAYALRDATGETAKPS